jgi:hypothetical protein
MDMFYKKHTQNCEEVGNALDARGSPTNGLPLGL